MKIGELAKIAHCTTETIRFYEKEGLLPEADRTEANYRSYTARHVERASPTPQPAAAVRSTR
jgi:DNA-binding transcriptional MerR regulator